VRGPKLNTADGWVEGYGDVLGKVEQFLFLRPCGFMVQERVKPRALVLLSHLEEGDDGFADCLGNAEAEKKCWATLS